MPDGTETPQEAAQRELDALKAQAAPEVAGIADKLTGAFWDKVKGFFASLAGVVWNDSEPTFANVFANAYDIFLGYGLTLTDEDTTQRIKDLVKYEDDPEVMLRELEAIAVKFPVFGWAYSMLHWIFVLSGTVRANMSAHMEHAQQSVFAAMRPSVIPPEAAIDALRKDPTLSAVVKDVLDRLGISDELQAVLHASANVPLSPGDARSAFLREFIDETKLTDSLRANHFTDDNIETIKELLSVLPPVQDIITMAVREVFSPDIVEKFGQMEGLPEDFTKWAAQQGLSAEWAGAYWAAHWSLPSIGQGFEMLHRAVIEESELDMLLRALDIMPFWRQKLTEISYNPLTRVDVRRMYALGVLDEAQVNKSYLDIGYSEENAKLMTDFTVVYTLGAEKELSKGDIIALFKNYAIDTDTATTMLTGLGYSEGNASLLVTRATFEIYSSYKKKRIGYVQRAYVAGKMSESQALGILGALDMPSTEINHLLDTWQLDRDSKVRALTVEQLKAFFTAKIIDTNMLNAELKELGYNDQDAARFVSLFSMGGAA